MDVSHVGIRSEGVNLPVQRSGDSTAVGAVRTIVDVLRRRAERRPADPVFTFIPDARAGARTLTFADLDARARSIASRLLDEGLRGERALLFYPAGLEVVEAFFGCLSAGVVAVPAFPPRANRTLLRLEAIAADAGARAALSPAGTLRRSREVASPCPTLGAL